jgi:hypothetical protein
MVIADTGIRAQATVLQLGGGKLCSDWVSEILHAHWLGTMTAVISREQLFAIGWRQAVF